MPTALNLMKHLPLISAIILLAAISFLYLQKEGTPTEPDAQTNTEPPKTQPKPEKSVEISDPPADPAKASSPPAVGKHCVIGEKTRDGIGIYYQGREIAHVMGHPAINWLERDNREAEESPRMAIKMIELKHGQVLADIGAGSGYYSLRLAMEHPESQIIGVDIQPEMLTFLEKRKKQLDVKNIKTHLGKIHDISLPPESIDAALMVDAYHEFSHPYEMIKSIYDAMRPGGRIYLLEYRAEDPNVPIKKLHKMSQAQAKKEMAFVGFEWERTMDQLPWQHFMIFKKP